MLILSTSFFFYPIARLVATVAEYQVQELNPLRIDVFHVFALFRWLLVPIIDGYQFGIDVHESKSGYAWLMMIWFTSMLLLSLVYKMKH